MRGAGQAPTSRQMEALRWCTPRIERWWASQSIRFPWRGANEPWRSLVVEILLQRTRAEAVADVYDSFFARFPTPEALGGASEEQVRDAIASLGLLWRAKHLPALGRELAELGGEPPEERAELERLPGVGPYAAGAYLTLHRGKWAPFVDANIVRLLGRFLGFSWDGETRRKRWLIELVDELFAAGVDPVSTGYGLLDFTRDVCSRSPQCSSCPLASRCNFPEGHL